MELEELILSLIHIQMCIRDRNKDNEVFAYYELIPYNYSFLSAEQKFIVHDSFRQLIAQSREGKIHALQIATESSIRSMQELSLIHIQMCIRDSTQVELKGNNCGTN